MFGGDQWDGRPRGRGRGRGRGDGTWGMGPGADSANLRSKMQHTAAATPLPPAGMKGADPSLRDRIIRAGDERPSLMEANIMQLTEDVERQVMRGDGDWIIDLLMKCVCKLGSKVPVLGVLVGMVNVEHPEFGKRVINAVHARLEDAVRADDFLSQKLILRFSASLCSSGVLYMSGLVGLLHDFLTVTRDTRAHFRRRDLCAYLVMSTIPYCCESLREHKREELEEIFGVLRDYMQRRPSVKDLLDGCLSMFQSFPPVDPGPLDAVEDAWEMVLCLMEGRWIRPDCLVTPLNDGAGRVASRIRRSPTQHQMPTLLIEGTKSRPKGVRRIPVSFRLLPSLIEVPVPNLWVIQDSVRDILFYFAGSRDYFEPELKHQPGVGGLKGNVVEGAKQILNLPSIPKFEGVVVEAILSEMLRLPNSTHPVAYYASTLIELCRLQSTMHPALGAAINYLFDAVPTMQAECVDRVVEWLSLHFSNFDWKWLWADWLDVVMLPEHAPKRRFVASLLQRCVRLSYFERIQNAVSVEGALELMGLIDKETTAVPPSEYIEDHMRDMVTEVQDMVSLARREECSVLEEYVGSNLSDLASETPTADRAKILVAAMVYEGRESFSHVLGIVGRYLKVLRSCVEGEQEQFACATAISHTWKKNPQCFVMVMDKFVAMKLISPINLAKWLLSSFEYVDGRGDAVWELMIMAIRKPVELVRTVRRDLSEAQKELDKLKQTSDEDDEDVIQKTDRIARIKNVLRSSTRDQDDILIAVIRGLVLLANECYERREAKEEEAAEETEESGNKKAKLDPEAEDGTNPKNGDTMDAEAEAEAEAEEEEDGDKSKAGKRKHKKRSGGDDKDSVWIRILHGRIMQVGRQYGAQLHDCHDLLEDELASITIKDQQLRKLLSSLQRLR